MKFQKKSTSFYSATLIVALLSSSACSKEIEKLEASQQIPGTPISLALPKAYKPALLGPTVMSADLATTITVMLGPSSNDPMESDGYKALFHNAPESVKTGNFDAKLYKRTRAQDGGAWDGWFLSSRNGKTSLNILASYTGTSEDEFEAIRKILLSATNSGQPADAEKAFGATAAVPGLRLVQSSVGGLGFTESGEAEATAQSLLFVPIPTPAGQQLDLTLDKCQQVFGASFQGGPFVGPHSISISGQPGCDAWSAESGRYVAVVALPNGALVQATGSGQPEMLRTGVLSLRPIRK